MIIVEKVGKAIDPSPPSTHLTPQVHAGLKITMGPGCTGSRSGATDNATDIVADSQSKNQCVLSFNCLSCNRPMVKEIYQCLNGVHYVCEECHKDLGVSGNGKCHHCRSGEIGFIRCRLAELLRDKVNKQELKVKGLKKDERELEVLHDEAMAKMRIEQSVRISMVAIVLAFLFACSLGASSREPISWLHENANASSPSLKDSQENLMGWQFYEIFADLFLGAEFAWDRTLLAQWDRYTENYQERIKLAAGVKGGQMGFGPEAASRQRQGKRLRGRTRVVGLGEWTSGMQECMWEDVGFEGSGLGCAAVQMNPRLAFQGEPRAQLHIYDDSTGHLKYLAIWHSNVPRLEDEVRAWCLKQLPSSCSQELMSDMLAAIAKQLTIPSPFADDELFDEEQAPAEEGAESIPEPKHTTLNEPCDRFDFYDCHHEHHFDVCVAQRDRCLEQAKTDQHVAQAISCELCTVVASVMIDRALNRRAYAVIGVQETPKGAAEAQGGGGSGSSGLAKKGTPSSVEPNVNGAQGRVDVQEGAREQGGVQVKVEAEDLWGLADSLCSSAAATAWVRKIDLVGEAPRFALELRAHAAVCGHQCILVKRSCVLVLNQTAFLAADPDLRLRLARALSLVLHDSAQARAGRGRAGDDEVIHAEADPSASGAGELQSVRWEGL